MRARMRHAAAPPVQLPNLGFADRPHALLPVLLQRLLLPGTCQRYRMVVVPLPALFCVAAGGDEVGLQRRHRALRCLVRPCGQEAGQAVREGGRYRYRCACASQPAGQPASQPGRQMDRSLGSKYMPRVLKGTKARTEQQLLAGSASLNVSRRLLTRQHIHHQLHAPGLHQRDAIGVRRTHRGLAGPAASAAVAVCAGGGGGAGQDAGAHQSLKQQQQVLPADGQRRKQERRQYSKAGRLLPAK